MVCKISKRWLIISFSMRVPLLCSSNINLSFWFRYTSQLFLSIYQIRFKLSKPLYDLIVKCKFFLACLIYVRGLPLLSFQVMLKKRRFELNVKIDIDFVFYDLPSLRCVTKLGLLKAFTGETFNKPYYKIVRILYVIGYIQVLFFII